MCLRPCLRAYGLRVGMQPGIVASLDPVPADWIMVRAFQQGIIVHHLRDFMRGLAACPSKQYV